MIDFLIRWSDKPFLWGQTDCCQFVGACIEYRTGRNPADDFPYEGRRGAVRLLREHGGLDGLLTRIFGEPHPEGREGDIALIDDQKVVGYVHNERIVVRADEAGLMDLPLSRAKGFWRE